MAIPLQFNGAVVNASFPGGAYTPEIKIVGRDSYSTMNGSVVTNPGELTIGDSEITLGLVVISPDQVLQGDTGIHATMTVQNQGIPLPIDPYPATRLVFRRHDTGVEQLVENLTRTDTLTVLRYNVPSEFEFEFDIPHDYLTGQIDVYGVLSLDDGNLIKISEYALGSFQSNSAGNANYVAGSLQPNTAIPRETINLKASFSNSGTADILLNPTLSYIEILNSGLGSRTLTGQFTLLGNSTTTLSFNSLTIPQSLATGVYNVRWTLYGTMSNGIVFSKTETITNGLTVLNPARLVFSTITIPATEVRLGQNDVIVDYKIRNQGQSSARVSSLNHKFRKSTGEEILNNQWVPLSLLPALPDTLTPGQERTYRAIYTILPSAPTGMVYPIPTVSYQDLRTISYTDIGQTIVQTDSVNVIRPASMYVYDLSIIQDGQAPNAPYVNQNREFSLKLVLHNSGEDFIETATVQILKQADETVIRELEVLDIGPGSFKDVLISISENELGTMTYLAFIDTALDVLGDPVLITPARDNAVIVYVQKPSNLKLEAAFAPEQSESDSLIVSLDQNFKVRVNLVNEGQSGFQQNGSLVLRLPAQYINFINAQDSIKSFTALQQYVEWDVRATAVSAAPPQDWNILIFDIKIVPVDLNSGQNVPCSIESDIVRVKVEDRGTIVQNIVAIVGPDGARDGEVSTDQIFEVQADIIFNATVADTGRSARLFIPTDYETIEADEIALPIGTDTCRVVWSVRAPDQAFNQNYLRVVVSAYDQNSGLSLSKTSNQTPVRTVMKARLIPSLRIAKFAGADNDTLSVGQTFILEALVANQGQAEAEGTGKIYIRELGANPAFTRLDTLNSASDTLFFTVGQTVRWYLQVNSIDGLEKTGGLMATTAQTELQDLFRSLQNETEAQSQYKTAGANNGFRVSRAAEIFNQIVSLLQSTSQ